jgi:DNA-binding MarR family transcriptional regulator
MPALRVAAAPDRRESDMPGRKAGRQVVGKIADPAPEPKVRHPKAGAGGSGSSASKISKMTSLPLPCADYPVYRQIIWDIVSIMDYLDEMRSRWAERIGVTGPQWKILMAIVDLDQGEGTSVGEVSAKVHAASTFVTTQTKLLEQRGYLKRVPSPSDARVVLMSLSDKALQHLAGTMGHWGDFHRFIFADFTPTALNDFAERLALVKKRTEIIRRRVGDEA